MLYEVQKEKQPAGKVKKICTKRFYAMSAAIN